MKFNFIIWIYTKITELTSVKLFDQQSVNVIIKLTNEVCPTSNEAVRMFNIIFKR